MACAIGKTLVIYCTCFMLGLTHSDLASGSFCIRDLFADDASYETCLDKHFCSQNSHSSVEGKAVTDLTLTKATAFRENDKDNTTEGCDCAASCHAHNTCCEDVYDKSKIPPVNQECINYGTTNFYAVTTCPESYTVTAIKQLCHTLVLAEDYNATPGKNEWFVSSHRTSYTYRNFYCALCNGETYYDLEFWSLKITCIQLLAPHTSNDATTINTSTATPFPPDFEGCATNFAIPEIDKCPAPFVGTCQSDYAYKDLVDRCSYGPMAVVHASLNSKHYRNIYCMLCNSVESEVACEFFAFEKKHASEKNGGNNGSFHCWAWVKLSNENCLHHYRSVVTLSLLVQPFTQHCEGEGADNEILSGCSQLTDKFSSCDVGEIYNLRKDGCEKLCPQPLVWENGYCVRGIADGTQCDKSQSRKDLVEYYTRHKYVTYFHDRIEVYGANGSTLCVNCSWISLQNDTLNHTNRAVKFNGTEYTKPFYYELGNGSLMVCAENKGRPILVSVCEQLDNPAVSITTMVISIISLTVMVIVYLKLPGDQWNIPGYIAWCQAMSLLLGFVFYLLREPATTNQGGCYFLSFLTHYLFLAAYFWSSMFGLEILLTLNANYTVNQRSRCKFIRYFVAGWTIPLIPVVIALAMDNIAGVDPDMQPQYGQPICWFTSQYGLYLYFLLPMAIMFCLNLLEYIAIVVTQINIAYNTRAARENHREKVILIVKLLFACGLLWVFGILAAIFRDNKPLTCIFLFINGLYGLVLSLTFLTSKTVCGSLKRVIGNSLSTASGIATRTTVLTATVESRL